VTGVLVAGGGAAPRLVVVAVVVGLPARVGGAQAVAPSAMSVANKVFVQRNDGTVMASSFGEFWAVGYRFRLMTMVRRHASVMVVIAALGGCRNDESSDVRGKGLSVAALSADAVARIYEAAARGAFDVDGTSLLVDRRVLPRGVGLADGGRLPDDVVAAMTQHDAIKGTCEPSLTETVGTAHCAAELPGYVVRYSPVFAITGDSVQVYIYAQKYDTPKSGVSETLRFERAYQVVRRGDEWTAVREGRVPNEARGER
jgi:hypothetical protein